GVEIGPRQFHGDRSASPHHQDGRRGAHPRGDDGPHQHPRPRPGPLRGPRTRAHRAPQETRQPKSSREEVTSMNPFRAKQPRAYAMSARFGPKLLHVELTDGHEISVPLEWFPKLLNATHEQRSHWTLIGRGIGIHWDDLDEDLSVAGLLGA